MCRQFIREFADLDTPIFMYDKDGEYVVMTLEQVWQENKKQSTLEIVAMFTDKFPNPLVLASPNVVWALRSPRTRRQEIGIELMGDF